VQIDPADLGHESEHVEAARILVTRRSFASDRSDGKRKEMRSKGSRLKVAGLVVLGTLLGTSGLAVAGVLPDTAQDMLSNVLDRVGISVPRGDHPASSGEPSEHPASSGEQISEFATTTDSTGVGKGAEISSIASGGMSQAGVNGSGSTAPVTTPNTGGTGTGDTASGGAADTGTATADDASQGHSSAGAANADDHTP
jgi:hypothetical protein